MKNVNDSEVVIRINEEQRSMLAKLLETRGGKTLEQQVQDAFAEGLRNDVYRQERKRQGQRRNDILNLTLEREKERQELYTGLWWLWRADLHCAEAFSLTMQLKNVIVQELWAKDLFDNAEYEGFHLALRAATAQEIWRRY